MKSKTDIDSKRDLHLSTYYEDQLLIEDGTKESRLDELSGNLDIEISLASDNILKLERLQERYLQDSDQSRLANNMGYYIRYWNAYERVTTLIEARYAPFRPVLNNGKQNVGQPTP